MTRTRARELRESTIRDPGAKLRGYGVVGTVRTINKRYGPRKQRQIARAMFAHGATAAGKSVMRSARRKSAKRR
jgi:hypothetical protein